MRRVLVRFAGNESGATVIEYVIIAGLLSIAIIAGAMALGTSLNTAFTDISTQFKGK